MSEYVIEENHPMPAVSPNKGKQEKYPWSKMDVGSSFFVEGGDPVRIKNAAGKAAQRSGKRFITRSVEGGVRIWRYE